ncbi:DNA-binding protein [Mycobacterium marinum]|uniref:DNA-binding protein n=2 Tax=Mycobacterium TaxID=1763 RepID=A0A7I7LB16_9MYCO|nr:Helix-turn-helix domain protein [Mycobacterium marinum]QYL27470.1 Helix-turn-helix domain protein [Mycobacterium shottsii]AXN48198.1 Helix-turn-helix domain protein [Mycobacterium marinum]RFZ12242.1 Helix-turn-helix domain protein [Mycobacterium marinum]RFZ13262.1 Helix-turn-helix domain protein [Mycobacterium marinum]
MHAWVPAEGKPLGLRVPDTIGLAMTSTNGPSARDSAGKSVRDSSGEGQQAGSQFLTVAEVASLMRVSKMTVYRLVHNGELPAVRVGRSFRVHAKAVHDMLQTSYFAG